MTIFEVEIYKDPTLLKMRAYDKINPSTERSLFAGYLESEEDDQEVAKKAEPAQLQDSDISS